MAGLLDLFGGDATQPGALYGGLLTPQQNAALSYRGLLAAAGALGQAAMPSRMPIPIGAALGNAAAAMGAAQDTSGENALKGMLVGLQGQNLASQIGIRNQIPGVLQQLMSGQGGAGAGASPMSGGSPTVRGSFGSDGGAGSSAILAKYGAPIQAAANDQKVDPDLIASVINAESGGNPNSVNSETGASGLGNLMPDTAKNAGVTNVFDPVQNINGVAKILRQGLDKYNGDVTQALKYYYGGPDESKWGEKTNAYPARVMANMPKQAPDNSYGFPAIAGSMPKLPPQLAQANTGTMSDALPPSSAAAGGAGTAGLLPSVNPTGNAGISAVGEPSTPSIPAPGTVPGPTMPPGAAQFRGGLPPGVKFNSQGVPYNPLMVGANGVPPGIGIPAAPSAAASAPQTSMLPPAAPQPGAPVPRGMLAPQAPQAAQATPAPSGAPAMSVGGMGLPQPPSMDPRALAAASVMGRLGGMGDLFDPLEKYYYQSPGYLAQAEGAKTMAGVPAHNLETQFKTNEDIRAAFAKPADLRTNGLLTVPGTGQILARNPAVPEGYTVGGNATNPIAEEIPGALQGISKVEAAKKGGGYQAEFGAVPGVQFTGNAANLSQPQAAPQTKPVPTPQGTQLPPISDQFMPQSPGELEHAIPAWQKKTDEWNAGIAPARQAEMRLGTIAQAFKMTETGAFETHKAELATALKALGIDPGLVMQTNPSAVQQALHDNILTTLPLLKAATPRPSQIEFMSVSENREHPNLQPTANLRMLTEDLALVRQAQQLPADWNAAQQQGWRNPQSFETAWSRLNPLDATRDQVEKEIGPLKGMPGNTTPKQTAPEGTIINGPNGQRLQNRGGQWLDLQTLKPYSPGQ